MTKPNKWKHCLPVTLKKALRASVRTLRKQRDYTLYFLEGPAIVIFFSFCEASLCHPGWPRMCYVDNVGLKFPEICLPLALLPRYRSCFCLKWSLKFVILWKKKTSGQYSKFKGVKCAPVCFLVLIAQTTDWASCREKGSTALVQGQEAPSAAGLLAG